MKTNPSFRIFKFSTLVPLAIAIAAALLTQPVHATAIQTLVITENSSTSLTAVLNGTTSLNVTPAVNPQTWFITLAGFSGTQQFWAEPEAGFVNFVQFAGSNNLLGNIFVASEDPSGVTGLADGTTDKTTFTLNGVELDVTFHDNGDVATTPDTGSTFGLLSLSVVALLGATRLRFLQLAA